MSFFRLAYDELHNLLIKNFSIDTQNQLTGNKNLDPTNPHVWFDSEAFVPLNKTRTPEFKRHIDRSSESFASVLGVFTGGYHERFWRLMFQK